MTMRPEQFSSYIGLLSCYCLTKEELQKRQEQAAVDLERLKSARITANADPNYLPEWLPTTEHLVSAQLHLMCMLTMWRESLSFDEPLPIIDPFILASTGHGPRGVKHFVIVPAKDIISQRINIHSGSGRIEVEVKVTTSDGHTHRHAELEHFYRYHLEVQESVLSRWFHEWLDYRPILIREIPDVSICEDDCLVRVLSIQGNDSEKTITGETLCLLRRNNLHPLMDFVL